MQQTVAVGMGVSQASSIGLGVYIGFIIMIASFFPYLAVRVGRDKERLHRLELLGRVVALFVPFLGLWIFVHVVNMNVDADTGAITVTMFVVLFVGIALVFAVSYFFFRFVVQRLNDVKWSPWLVYICIVPMVNVLFIVLLCIVPPRESETIVLEAG